MTQTGRGNGTAKGRRWRAVVFVGAKLRPPEKMKEGAGAPLFLSELSSDLLKR
jgi:hypothetical protein